MSKNRYQGDKWDAMVNEYLAERDYYMGVK